MQMDRKKERQEGENEERRNRQKDMFEGRDRQDRSRRTSSRTCRKLGGRTRGSPRGSRCPGARRNISVDQ
jgi:hypothetical protein